MRRLVLHVRGVGQRHCHPRRRVAPVARSRLGHRWPIQELPGVFAITAKRALHLFHRFIANAEPVHHARRHDSLCPHCARTTQVLVVYHGEEDPSFGNSFASLGFAGFTGTITGMSKNPMVRANYIRFISARETGSPRVYFGLCVHVATPHAVA